jgi:hypothetical protein
MYLQACLFWCPAASTAALPQQMHAFMQQLRLRVVMAAAAGGVNAGTY